MSSVDDVSARDRVGADAGPRASGWTGWIVFAAALLLMAGAFQLVQGLVALFDDGYYVVGSDGLAVPVDYTVWGIVQLLVGTLACLIGIGLLTGNMVARGA